MEGRDMSPEVRQGRYACPDCGRESLVSGRVAGAVFMPTRGAEVVCGRCDCLMSFCGVEGARSFPAPLSWWRTGLQ